ncbi:MAG TPA: class I tRNA ligase family protein [Holophagaceae bacterium]
MAEQDLAPLDRWALAAFGRMAKEVREAYRTFEFHRATQALHGFCQLELSGRYFEIVKDRLYCDALDSPRRRSCRHTCRELAKGLCTLLAPVMSFTADEAWEQIPGVEASVHEQRFPEAPVVSESEAWTKLWEVRATVQASMEPLRVEKAVGTSLDAEVQVTLKSQADWDRLDDIGEPLDELLVVSGLTRIVDPNVNFAPGVIAGTHPGLKCPRCWNHKGGHGTGEDADLCARCASVVGA